MWSALGYNDLIDIRVDNKISVVSNDYDLAPPASYFEKVNKIIKYRFWI